MSITKAVLVALFCFAFGEVFLNEKFEEGFEKRWVQSKRDGLGVFTATLGEFSGASGDHGIKTSQDAKFYAYSTAHKTVSNIDNDLVLQFLVKFEQGIDCGGGYLKFLPKFNQEDFDGSSKYNVMFGPDICGSTTKKVHLIFNYKGKNLDWKKSLSCESDKLSHIYTAIIRKDGTYEVLIDGQSKESGKLIEDWEFTQPKTIPDPTDKKPEDWVDVREIVDPNDKKPDDWEKPKTIPDTNAKKPDDWNDEEDGKWEPAQVPNPEYRGDYSAKMVPNPAYKGEWKAREIPNPDYVEDPSVAKYKDFSVAGIDVWQVKSGTIFDDILVTDSVEEAETIRKQLLEECKKEKEASDKHEEEKRKEEEAKAKQSQDSKPEETPEDLEKLAKEKAEQLKKDAPEKKDEL